jgi:response regulator RpfG family c-di-GMP phosphodiesterase
MNTTVLLLEPDHDLNRLFTYHLQTEGYRVHALHRWQDAQLVLSVHIPDLIIFDWVSTATGGYQWVRQVHQAPATAHIPLLVLCCDALPTDRRAWDALAGSTVIESPIDLERFRQQVQALVAPSARVVGAPLA